MNKNDNDAMTKASAYDSSGNYTTTNTGGISDGSLISVELHRIFMAINVAIVCQFFVVFGTTTNVINIVVFVKLGFKESINISLLGLAITDLLSCAILVWNNICLAPWFQDLELPFDPNQLYYLTSGGPHVMFTRITGVITGFITFERCLCVIIPLKVKSIITTRRSTIFVVATYVILLAGFAPVYYVNQHAWVFNQALNRSILGLVFTDDREEIEAIQEPIYHIAVPLITFLFVIVCTVLLVTTLKRQAKWRTEATGGAAHENSMKEKRIAVMVAAISILFIVCFLPSVVILAVMQIDREISVAGKRRRLWSVLFSFVMILETVNSSMNIFIYYHQNTNYRRVLNFMCGRNKKEKQ